MDLIAPAETLKTRYKGRENRVIGTVFYGGEMVGNRMTAEKERQVKLLLIRGFFIWKIIYKNA